MNIRKLNYRMATLAGSSKNLVRILQIFPVLHRFINRVIINYFSFSTVPRPHRYSLWSPSDPWTEAVQPFPATQERSSEALPRPIVEYTSWAGLVDRSFTGRHRPPRVNAGPLPQEDEVLDLFMRREPMRKNPRSNALFCFFAQWFTDSFLRTHPQDPRRNTSNHEIDLCQIYGLDEPSTWALRSGEGGRLRSRLVGGAEYPALLYKNGALDPEFFTAGDESGLSYLRGGRNVQWENALEGSLKGTISDPARRDWLYAAGLDRGNSTIAYSAINTIFLREHNRLAKALQTEYPRWDDNRLFETARLINIRQALTIVVNDYIYHIGGLFPFLLDRSFAEGKRWYRTNRISIEFNLLYRWHSLAPDSISVAGQPVEGSQYRFNNALLEEHGVEQVLNDSALTPAGYMGLFNTPVFLRGAERKSLKLSRAFELQCFNDYREHFGMSRYRTIDDLVGDDKKVAEALKALYGKNVDDVEFTVGLFAEKRGKTEVMPETLRTIVAYDAFTHILTNPALAAEVHLKDTFSDIGWELIEKNLTFDDLVRRNVDGTKLQKLSFDI